MGSVETGNRQRNVLPSIDAMEMDRKDGPGYHRGYPTPMSTDLSVKTTPMASPPSSMYPSGPPPPYSSFPSSASSAPSGVPAPSSGYISPDSRRSGEDESRDHPQSQSRPHPTPHQNQTPQKQSLPSIKEALGHDDPYTAPGPTSVPPQQQQQAPSSSHHPHAAPAQPSSSTLVSRPNPEAPLGPPNPFSSGSPSTPYPHNSTTVPPQQSDPQRSSRVSINSQDSRNQSLPSLTSGKSPSQSSRTGAPSLNSQASSYEYGTHPPQAPGNMSSPSGYYPQQAFPYPAQGPGSSYPPPTTLDQRPAYLGPPWKPGGPDAMQVDDGKGMFRGSSGAQPHSESVKRHLDGYDVEASLNEISDGSSRTVEFARVYGARAHQAQRSGPILGSLPSLAEVEEMMQVQRRNADAFARIRSAIMTQEHALAEQRQRQQQQQQQQQQRHHYKDNGYADDAGMFQEEFKGAGGFAGADSKKRRGKAAPPGRCHSCNRAETPEWRRGPDGARTLCNACGLHYAKLTRKLGANKASSLGSNLQPKRGSGGSVEATTSPPRHMAVQQGQPPPPHLPQSLVQQPPPPPPPPATHHHHHQHM